MCWTIGSVLISPKLTVGRKLAVGQQNRKKKMNWMDFGIRTQQRLRGGKIK